MERDKVTAMVKAVQNGSESAAEEMYEAFQGDLYYYIFKTVNDPELAADLTQDTFIEILQSIHSLQEPAAFVTWSRQIAYRRCTAYFKKRRDLLADEDEDGYSIFDTVQEEREEFIPCEALDKEELKQTIHGIINKLPEEQRSAIMMRYFEELSVADIAKIQGVSEGTVKSRLNYGRKAIGKSVEEYEKKHDIKLHCAGVVPLLLWLLREFRVANGLSITTGTAATTATVSSAASATAVTTTAAAKTAGAALVTKIAAGVVAAAVTVTGVVLHVQKRENAVCDHQKTIQVIEMSQKGAEPLAVDTCTACGWVQDPPVSDEPIYVSANIPWVMESVTEQSYANIQKVLGDIHDNVPGEVNYQLVGLLYYYDEEVPSFGLSYNRLVLVYHLDNGIVPGGWYTYVSAGDVALRTIQDADGNPMHSVFTTATPRDEHLPGYPLYLVTEEYAWWASVNHPIHFIYEKTVYSGHRTMEDCLTALEKNCIGGTFDHLIVGPGMEDFISGF